MGGARRPQRCASSVLEQRLHHNALTEIIAGVASLDEASSAAKSPKRPKRTDISAEALIPAVGTSDGKTFAGAKARGKAQGICRANEADSGGKRLATGSEAMVEVALAKPSTSQAPSQIKSSKKSKVVAAPVPADPEILEAVCSLCVDELRPYGRILRKRVAELAEQRGARVGECDLSQLRAACAKSVFVEVVPEDGGEWSALLVGELMEFIDIYSREDLYPSSLWLAAAEYFGGPSGEVATLPAGRYACGQALYERKLPFLAGYSLGCVCHIVELALSQKKILGRTSGGITAYALSDSKAKDAAASQQSACANAEQVPGLEMASWESARVCLKQMLGDLLRSGQTHVPLSNIKRILRLQFNIELSETLLGHTKLSELLQDKRLQDVCAVRLLDQGYVVVPQVEAEGVSGHAFRWADACVSPVEQTSESLQEVADGVFPDTPVWYDDLTHAPVLLAEATGQMFDVNVVDVMESEGSDVATESTWEGSSEGLNCDDALQLEDLGGRAFEAAYLPATPSPFWIAAEAAGVECGLGESRFCWNLPAASLVVGWEAPQQGQPLEFHPPASPAVPAPPTWFPTIGGGDEGCQPFLRLADHL